MRASRTRSSLFSLRWSRRRDRGLELFRMIKIWLRRRMAKIESEPHQIVQQHSSCILDPVCHQIWLRGTESCLFSLGSYARSVLSRTIN